MIVDGFIIDYGTDQNAFSKGFYSKLVLSILYLIGSKDISTIKQTDNSIDAAFHFSVFSLCIWMGVTSFVLEGVSISRIVGIFLIFGGLAAFNLIDELLKVIRLKVPSPSTLSYATETVLKIFLFSIFCLALFFLAVGEWVWELKPFYEW
ncbi:hypothetical protein [Pseudoalteromonas sp. SaAl2]